MRVKICGITRREDLDAAVRAGADAVGFVTGFESSPRNISLRTAGELISMVPPFVQSVLVTTGYTISARRREIEAMHPGALQVYGEGVTSSLCEMGGTALIRPYFVSGRKDPEEEIEGFDALMTTGHPIGSQGGVGSAPDLDVCARLRTRISPKPLILSGGLRPENVGKAIRVVRPYAVDVSSGVEATPGVKDEAKLEEFVRNAKELIERG